MIGSNRPAHKSSTAFLMALVLSSTALTSVALTTGASANDLPSGATVTAGSVDIQSQADGLLINQATQNAIINWHDFSVGRDRSVHFNNGSGATLNRVTGPHISRIDGSLSATGSLYLVNQHGIVIGKDGVVKTGGSFVASTLDISDEDFLDGGSLTFKGDANTKIINQGKVGSLGGDVAFISRHIVNEGSISAPNGSVGLAVGREVLLQDAELDDGKFLVKVGDADSSITEAGVIDAASVELRAHGGNIYALAGNKGGAINASGTSRSGGRIFLTAGGGKVSVKKTLRAKSRRVKSRRVKTASKARSSIYINADVVNLAGLLDVSNEEGLGGKIDVGGNVISLTGARLNADGSQGGGDIRVGGAYQGGDFGDLTTATVLTVDDQTLLTASATDAGDGGDIVLWSDELTSFAGRIEAKGMQDGKGGDAEVSGKAKLAYLGFADLTSESGVFGTLLLDPYNVTLSNEPAFNSSGLAATGDDSNINITTLQNQLASAHVTITTNGAGSQHGDILVADDITWDADTNLTLNADRNIAFFANVTKRGMGGLILNHGAGGDYIIADGASIDLTGAGQYLTINGQNYTLISNMAQLDNIDNTGLGGRYALATDLDATGTTYGDALVGIDYVNPFTGVFTGLGNTISNLTIGASGDRYVGLFGATNGATVRNVNLSAIDVSGYQYVGGLVGENKESTISHVSANGISRSYNGRHGGLVGFNWDGTVEHAQANVAVTAAGIWGPYAVGGLVGLNSGVIRNSSATGSVKGHTNTGGLVGVSFGTISNSHATGATTGNNNVGGLAGNNIGTIDLAYANGSVTGIDDVGGFVGTINGGTISRAYASGQVTGTGSRIGGFVGNAFQSTINPSFFDSQTAGLTNPVGANSNSSVLVAPLTTAQARNRASYTAFDFTNDWYQNADMRPILRAEGGPTINGVTAVSNLHQLALMDTDIQGDYQVTKNIDGSATQGTNTAGIWSNEGWVPIGMRSQNTALVYRGTFDGNGKIISGLQINRPSSIGWTGLYAVLGQSGRIEDIGLENINFTGGGYVGGLTGQAERGDIKRSYVTGSVTGSRNYIGGLVGFSSQTSIHQSHADVTATGTGSDSDHIGGLVGHFYSLNGSASITESYATGNVSGDDALGGLVGYFTGRGSITQSYATGDVSNENSNDGRYHGGLVGYSSSATINQSYATGSVSGDSDIGGLIGSMQGGAVNQAYAKGNVSGQLEVGGLIGVSSQSNIAQSYATGSVSGSAVTGGLIGWSSGGTLQSSFFDLSTTGQSTAIGTNVSHSPTNVTNVTGLTAAQFQDTDAFMTLAGDPATYGWDFNNVWSPPSAGYYPELYAVNPVIWVEGSTTTSTYGQSTGTVSSIFQHGGVGTYVFGPMPDSMDLTGSTVAVDPTVNAGTHRGDLVTQNVFENSDQGQNFRVFYHGSAVQEVAKADLTVTANNASKTYGTLAPLTGYTPSGLVNSDNITSLTLTSTGAPVSANVGTYDIVASNANGIGLENYNINYVKGTLTVAKAPLAIYVDNASKTYGTAAAPFTYTPSGLVTANGDSITSLDLASLGAPVSANTGTYAITADNAQGNRLENYDISYVNGELTVNPAQLSITAHDASKTYGSAFTPTGYTVAGLVDANGDSVTSLSLNTAGSPARADVGSYDIIASNAQGSGLTHNGGSNYIINYVKGNLDVTKKPLTITGSNVTKTYGDTGSLGSLSHPALVAGDSLTYTLSSNGQVNTANVGTYDIDAAISGTSGLGNNPLSHNYDITLQKGQLTINPRAITVTALGGSSIYGDVPTNPGLSASNLASFDSVSALNGLSNSFGIDGTTNAGTYTTQVAGSLSNPNYTITQRVDGTWTVNRRLVYIFPHDQSRQYGAANPTLTYDIGWRGLVNGDVLNGALSTPANVTSPVGQYAITAGTLTNANNPNYDISVQSFGSNERPVFLHVTPAPLTITASDASKNYGQYFQPTAYSVAGLLNMDSVDALTLFSTGSPASAPVGNYDIVPSGASGQGLSNYTITYVNGRLTVQDTPDEVVPPRITTSAFTPQSACQDRLDKEGVEVDEDGTFARLQRFDCETDMTFDEGPKFN